MAKGRSPRKATTHAYPRSVRLGETLREVLADELVRIDDERLEFVTVTRVDVDPEMNRAILYFDSLRGEQGDADIIEVLGGTACVCSPRWDVRCARARPRSCPSAPTR